MISVYADGSSSGGSSKPGGYGWIIARGEEVLSWGYGGASATTNNLMEAEGAIQGMAHALTLGLPAEEPRELVCDSQYVLGIASGGYSPTKNLEQAKQLVTLAQELRCRFRWVKGHAGNPFNEKCDVLAKQGKLENTPEDQRQAKPQRRRAARKALQSL